MIKAENSFYISLIERLRKLPSETSWFDFKMNNEKPDLIGQYISSLSNSATLAGKENGYLIWGVDNNSHEVKGTKFNPSTTKIGNEELENWLITQTNPRLDIKFVESLINDKKVVILEIPCASDYPTSFKDIEYIRVGSYNKKLKEFKEKERTLWRRFEKVPFEMSLAMEDLSEANVTEFLDCSAYFTLMNLPLPSNRKAIIEKMSDEKFINEMVNGNYAITNMGALLFAKNLDKFQRLKRKAIRVIQYKGTGRTNAIREEIFTKGYAIAYEEICKYIMTLLPQREEINGSFRKLHVTFSEKSIRELVGNLMIHQDLTVRGAGPMLEIFEARVESSNPGNMLVDIDRIIDTTPNCRNEAMASFLRIIQICEERGSGFDRMEEGMSELKIPAPKVETTDDFTRVKLFWYPDLNSWKKEERIRTCYLATCYCYVNGIEVSNSVMRERFGVEEKNMAIISRIIKETLDADFIKIHEGNTARKNRKYLPYWA